MNIKNSYGASLLINKPTRVSDSSATIIDLIITNDSDHNITPRIVISSLTDHYPILCQISNFATPPKLDSDGLASRYRDKSKFNSEIFLIN